jgi:hypothetical protein
MVEIKSIPEAASAMARFCVAIVVSVSSPEAASSRAKLSVAVVTIESTPEAASDIVLGI